MSSLEDDWPDDDRRDDALYRIAKRMSGQPPVEDRQLSRMDLLVLEALSHGLDRNGAAEVLGIGLETVKLHLRRTAPVLKAKTTTQACCEALRRGLIR